MSVRENLKSCKILRQIKAGILSAVMFTGSVMANYAGLIGNSTMFAVGEEETAVVGESSKTLAEITKDFGYEITLKPNGQWKVTFKPKEAGDIVTEIPANVMSASEFDAYRDNIDEVMIPNGVTKIAAHAFEGVESLNTVSGCYSVTTIGDEAFKGCTHLRACIHRKKVI